VALVTKVMAASAWMGKVWGLVLGSLVAIRMLNPQQGQRKVPSSVTGTAVSNGAGRKCGI